MTKKTMPKKKKKKSKQPKNPKSKCISYTLKGNPNVSSYNTSSTKTERSSRATSKSFQRCSKNLILEKFRKSLEFL